MVRHKLCRKAHKRSVRVSSATRKVSVSLVTYTSVSSSVIGGSDIDEWLLDLVSTRASAKL